MARAIGASVGYEGGVLACITSQIYPSIFKTLTYFETMVCSESWQICTLKHFIQNPL